MKFVPLIIRNLLRNHRRTILSLLSIAVSTCPHVSAMTGYLVMMASYEQNPESRRALYSDFSLSPSSAPSQGSFAQPCHGSGNELADALCLVVILSAAKNPGSFSAQNTSTSLRAREAELLRILINRE
jgi:hypothetical protein